MGDRSPMRSSDLYKLNKLLIRALTKKQILLLFEINRNDNKSLTSLISKLSAHNKIPISTLKLNAQLLKELELIDYGLSNPVKLTQSGRIVLELISDFHGKD